MTPETILQLIIEAAQFAEAVLARLVETKVITADDPLHAQLAQHQAHLADAPHAT